MSNIRTVATQGRTSVVVFEPDDGMPTPPATLPSVGDEIEVWLIGFDDVDDHWTVMEVYEIERNTIRCGYSPTGIWWEVSLTGIAATWRWPKCAAKS